MSPWYDDPQQIDVKLTDLAGIQEVLTVRQKAGFERHEQLSELVLLGRLHLDQHGQMRVFEEGLLPPEDSILVPPVCTWEEFRMLVEERGTPPKDGRWCRGVSSSRGSYELPTATRRCPICGKGWDLTNFWDVHVDQDFHELPLDEFVGKTIGEMGDAIADRPEASYHFAISGDGIVTIRPAGVPSAESLYREEGCTTCGPSIEEREAWVAKHKKVPFTYIVQEEDRGGTIHPFRYQSYHGTCYQQLCDEERAEQLRAMQQDLTDVLKQVGFSKVSVKSALPPQTLLEQLKGEFDEDEAMTPEAVAREMPYFAVSTTEGKFGVMIGGENIPWIDLAQTPFTLQDLGAPPEHCQPGSTLAPLMSPELGNLRLLLALFRGKHGRKKRRHKK